MTILAILLSVHVGMGMLWALSVILKTFAFRDGYRSKKK